MKARSINFGQNLRNRSPEKSYFKVLLPCIQKENFSIEFQCPAFELRKILFFRHLKKPEKELTFWLMLKCLIHTIFCMYFGMKKSLHDEQKTKKPFNKVAIFCCQSPASLMTPQIPLAYSTLLLDFAVVSLNLRLGILF